MRIGKLARELPKTGLYGQRLLRGCQCNVICRRIQLRDMSCVVLGFVVVESGIRSAEAESDCAMSTLETTGSAGVHRRRCLQGSCRINQMNLHTYVVEPLAREEAVMMMVDVIFCEQRAPPRTVVGLKREA